MITGLCLVGCYDGPPYQVLDDGIPKPLTSQTADPKRGSTLFSMRGDAHCVLCHNHSGIDVQFPGNMGPDLSTVSQRLSEAQIRLRIVDYDYIKPGTTMPSYFRTQNLHQVEKGRIGETVLTALEIEDIIAFLIE